jgi:uncharacterized protein (UPF0333 family)
MKAKRNIRRRGQTATEYMMVVSVVVIAVVGAAYAFVPTFETGVNELGYDVSAILSNSGSRRGGFGTAAGTVSGNGNGATSSTNADNGTVGAYDPMSGMGDAPSIQ